MAKRKYSKRMTSPDPQVGRGKLGCLIPVLVVFGTLAALAWKASAPVVAVLLAFPACVAAAFWLYGRLLVAAAAMRWGFRGERGVLVLSDSPNWRPYIDERWLPVIGGRLRTLNWSERTSWRRSLDVLLWRYFCGRHQRNYCPSAVVLRGWRHPLVFRFHHAFQNAKHGDDTQLRALEEALFRVL